LSTLTVQVVDSTTFSNLHINNELWADFIEHNDNDTTFDHALCVG